MKHRFISSALTATVLLLSASLSFAIDTKAAAPGESGHSAKDTKNATAAQGKGVARIKLVDINAASKAELMKLPGIHSKEADRIIAGRPYGSQAWLVSNKIIPEALYPGLKDKIIAIQHQPIPKKPADGGKKTK